MIKLYFIVRALPVAFLLVLCFAANAASAPRSISVDCHAVKGRHATVFRTVVGAGRVGEGLRADWRQQLAMCRTDIGFQYLRCHDLLHDELGVYREDKNGNPLYNWQYIDSVYDYLLSIGVRPFVEVGFMPDALATIPTEKADSDGMVNDPGYPGGKRRVTVFWRKSNVTPPKSWPKWDALITALVKHWTERYGAAEVQKWYFEIWNEPNHPAFFSPNNPADHMGEYFTLYAHTARDIKGVDPKYRVGGTAGAGPAWIPEFIAYGVKNSVPIDFISYHIYGLAGGPSGLDEHGNKLTYLSKNLLAVAGGANSQRPVIDKSARPGLPIFITEWSASYSDRDPIHDSYFEAPYILEQIKNTEGLAGMSYWTFTDVFEENGPPPRPFHGGFGLVTEQGIKKPAYFAYKFMNQLGGQELANADPESWVCQDGKGGIQALFWDLTDPRSGRQVADQEFFRQVDPAQAKTTVKLTVKSLKPGKYRLSLYKIGYEKNDAYSAYLKLGAPSQISRTTVTRLKALASGMPDSTATILVGNDGRWAEDFPLRANDVVLAKLTPLQ